MADLNADEEPDYVITVRSSTGSKLLMVHLSGQDVVKLISRNEGVQYPTPQKIEVIRPDSRGAYPSQGLIGDGLIIIKLESSSSFVYWNGIEFSSQWLGD